MKNNKGSVVEVLFCEEKDTHEFLWKITGYFSEYFPARLTGNPDNYCEEEGGELEKMEVELLSVNGETPIYYYKVHAKISEDKAEAALYEKYANYNPYFS